MKKYIMLTLAILMVIAGCATAPEPEAPPEEAAPAMAAEPRQAEEPEKEPEPVYETVTVPLKTKETVYFSDGVVDRYTEISYIDDTALVEREETYNTYDELLESVTVEYEDNLPVKRLTYGPDSKLRSYTVSDYNEQGLLLVQEFYDRKDNLQTRSTYEYDDSGRKVRWSVYGGSNNLLSYTDYLYDEKGRLVEMKIYSPDGTLEDTFAYEYDGSGMIPVKQIRYTAAGAVEQIEEFRVENGLVMEKRTLLPSGAVEYRFEYEYGDHGELLREAVYAGEDNLMEYYEMEYTLREETRLVEGSEE